jgi:hypothetical protein
MMSGMNPAGADWSDTEVDLIVADYFEMLRLERAGQPYVKAQRNAALQELTGRSRGSIEFKYQNISAVLLKLGMDWIAGYKPMSNFQTALLEGVERYLDSQDDMLLVAPPPLLSGAAEDGDLFLEPPPKVADGPPDPPSLTRLVRKFDPAARDARNRQLGRAGEQRIFEFERQRLLTLGRSKLADKVRWIAQEDGDGAGYDILSFDAEGGERFIEVKTTSGHQTTPFYLSENERRLSEERPDAFRLVRLYGFGRDPRAFELSPPLAAYVLLQPANYRAAFE